MRYSGNIDSQSVRTGLPQSIKGIDGGKKIKGIKRDPAVDSTGIPLTIVTSRTNVHDRKGAMELVIDTVCKYPTAGGLWNEPLRGLNPSDD